ncbi:MAG: FHA domain-containing protein, partial [Mycobacterium sp.]|nr:FHA domain-containing protein [Mycobacterium sp.]
MNQPSAPVLTVRYNGPPRTFAAGHDVVVGRDLRADVRLAHPLVSRAHIVLRFEHGRWKAIDNGSLNGMYVYGRRVPEVDITDGTTVNLGNPDGPPLRFEVGRQQGPADRPPQTSTVMIPGGP